ncbi:hypothetical protein [Paracoccus sp. (in: a-proteobacteria)]|uniref:hypothetical protein n=1 Tax=Paracoccus sp. TaxID=267 RepID=UPI00322001D1
MELSRSLTWQPAPKEEGARLGPEGSLLLDCVCGDARDARARLADGTHEARCAALRALITAAPTPPETLAALERLGSVAPPDRMLPPEPCAGDELLSPEALPPDAGAAAVVGVIDHAIPFAHSLLTAAGGHSRVAAIWLQGAPVSAPRPDIPFGQELRGSDIDRLRGIGARVGAGVGAGPGLDADDLYRRLGVLDPGRPEGRWLMRDRSHGAAIACMAAGHAPGDSRGLAHPLIGVSLPDWALADTSGAAMPLLLQAGVLFIVSRARLLARQLSARSGRPVRLPLVVNLSLGITAGPRDGSSAVERLQDAIAATPPEGLGPVHFLLSCGNSRQQRLHALLSPGQGIGWQLLPDDRTRSELQVWSAPQPPGEAAIRLELTLPDGRGAITAFHPPAAGSVQVARLRDEHGRELARLALQARAGAGGSAGGVRQVLTVILPPSAADTAAPVLTAPGTWNLRLMPDSPGDCEFLVQRDDRIAGFPRAGRQSRLVDPAYAARLPGGGWPGADASAPDARLRRNGTCNAYAWGVAQIRIGAAIGPAGLRPARAASYGGLLADGRAGDLLAPADRGPARAGVIAPGSRGRAMQAVGGTSIATPMAARWLAARLAGGAGPGNRAEVVAAAQGSAPAGDMPPRVDADLPWTRAGAAPADHCLSRAAALSGRESERGT